MCVCFKLISLCLYVTRRTIGYGTTGGRPPGQSERSVSVYLCLYVSLCLCLCVCVSVCLCVCVYVSLCLCVTVSLCLGVSVSLFLFVCVSMSLPIWNYGRTASRAVREVCVREEKKYNLVFCVFNSSLSLCLCVYVTVCLCLFVSVSIRLCVCVTTGYFSVSLISETQCFCVSVPLCLGFYVSLCMCVLSVFLSLTLFL